MWVAVKHEHAPKSVEVSRQGPTGRKSTKGGVSGPAEDLLPVSEVEVGGKFSASRLCTGAGCWSLTGRQPGTGTRRAAGRRCVKPRSRGSECQKGDARACMLPANLDHLRVEWMKRGDIRDCLGHARARLSVFIQVWTWSSSHTTN